MIIGSRNLTMTLWGHQLVTVNRKEPRSGDAAPDSQ